jgi:hypothetical protein
MPTPGVWPVMGAPPPAALAAAAAPVPVLPVAVAVAVQPHPTHHHHLAPALPSADLTAHPATTDYTAQYWALTRRMRREHGPTLAEADRLYRVGRARVGDDPSLPSPYDRLAPCGRLLARLAAEPADPAVGGAPGSGMASAVKAAADVAGLIKQDGQLRAFCGAFVARKAAMAAEASRRRAAASQQQHQAGGGGGGGGGGGERAGSTSAASGGGGGGGGGGGANGAVSVARSGAPPPSPPPAGPTGAARFAAAVAGASPAALAAVAGAALAAAEAAGRPPSPPCPPPKAWLVAESDPPSIAVVVSRSAGTAVVVEGDAEGGDASWEDGQHQA